MTSVRRRKLIIILLLGFCLSIAVSLVLYALRQNLSFFYNPTQVSQGEPPLNHIIRVGGMVEKKSIVRQANGLQVQFKITDYAHTMTVFYKGILPDLFREGQGIVAEGILVSPNHFEATQVLAKHDENYMPPEVKASLKKKASV